MSSTSTIEIKVPDTHNDGMTTKLCELIVMESENQHEETVVYKYCSGIPTLRSSAHRVRYSDDKASRNKNAQQPQPQPQHQHQNSIKSSKSRNQNNDPSSDESNLGTLLPSSIRKERILTYDESTYNIKYEIIKLLQTLDPNIVGCWDYQDHDTNRNIRLEDFIVPPDTLKRGVHGGKCEDAQKYLSESIASNESFLDLFDRFVVEYILPQLKQRLIEENVIQTEELTNENHDCSSSTSTTTTITFYYQRPPTLRLQPGPAKISSVKPHRDADYGHQPGELNYWLPLTDRQLTKVDLWIESDYDTQDFHPLITNLGEISSFHGSLCKHYVNRNESCYTRVSLDFRVGIEPFYDPGWQMIGTAHDHSRRKVTI